MERIEPGTSHAQLFDELTELVLMAEQAGFETAWIGEHHGMEFTIAPNPLINLAYLGARTSRIRLGTGTVVAPFWHPIKLAGEAALTDVATGGRLDLGLPIPYLSGSPRDALVANSSADRARAPLPADPARRSIPPGFDARIRALSEPWHAAC
jgi:hypothetical protein